MNWKILEIIGVHDIIKIWSVMYRPGKLLHTLMVFFTFT